MKNDYMWALMLTTGEIYKDDTGYWKDVFDIHAIFKTRKAAREHAKIFKGIHRVRIINVLIEG